jgi:hypothetical protein
MLVPKIGVLNSSFIARCSPLCPPATHPFLSLLIQPERGPTYTETPRCNVSWPQWSGYRKPAVRKQTGVLPALMAGHQLPLLVQGPTEGLVDLLRGLPIAGKRLAGYRVVPHLAESAGPSDDLIRRVRGRRSKDNKCRRRQKTSQLCHVKAPHEPRTVVEFCVFAAFWQDRLAARTTHLRSQASAATFAQRSSISESSPMPYIRAV